MLLPFGLGHLIFFYLTLGESKTDGDVYKRQGMGCPARSAARFSSPAREASLFSSSWRAVSYTHLDVYKRQGTPCCWKARRKG